MHKIYGPIRDNQHHNSVSLNSRTLKFTILQCAIQWFLEHSRGCRADSTIDLQDTFLTPKRNPTPISSYPPGLLPPAPGTPRPICFLSLQICLLRTFPTRGILQYEAFSIWLLSLSAVATQVVAGTVKCDPSSSLDQWVTAGLSHSAEVAC